jgi:UDP-galactopyranose mutase
VQKVDINKYDILIVGTGFAGSTIAYLAAKRKKRVLIIEKRNHIAGNMYDEKDKETNILVHRYGPHIFFTDNQRIYDFIVEVGKWQPFLVKGRVNIDDKFVPSPFNFTMIDTFFTRQKADEIKVHLSKAYGDKQKTTITSMLEHKDVIVREYADFLFEKDYKPYTVKQWGIKPEELDVSVLDRVPVRLDYTDRLNDSRYQLLPNVGFTKFFETMLDQPGIDIKLNIDANDLLAVDADHGIVKFDGKCITAPVLYTGALDELMKYKYGRLPYRSVNFRYEVINTESFQETSFSIHPFASGYNRITEYTKLPFQDGKGKTLISYEYPVEYEIDKGQIPYYPVLTKNSMIIYEKYFKDISNIKNFFPCGRLADFRYYNMDKTIERAFDVFSSLENLI